MPGRWPSAPTATGRSVRRRSTRWRRGSGTWRPGCGRETELLLWKPPTAWFSINAFFTAAGLRNWYVNFEHTTRRTESGFDTFDLVIDPDLSTWTWKDEDEYTPT